MQKCFMSKTYSNTSQARDPEADLIIISHMFDYVGVKHEMFAFDAFSLII